MDERMETPQPEATTQADATRSAGSVSIDTEDGGTLAGMSVRSSIESIARSLVINGAIPLLIYNILKSRGATDITEIGPESPRLQSGDEWPSPLDSVHALSA